MTTIYKFSEIFKDLFPWTNTVTLIRIPILIEQVILPLSTAVKLVIKLNYKLINVKEIHLPHPCWRSWELFFLPGWRGSSLYFLRVTSLLHSLLTTRQFFEDVSMILMNKRRLAFDTSRHWAVDFSSLWLLSDPSLPSCNLFFLNLNIGLLSHISL